MRASKMLFMRATALFALVSVVLAIDFENVLKPPPIAGSQDVLPKAEIIQLKGAVGPESIAFDPNGEGPYTGVGDGRILKWLGDAQAWVDFAVTSSHRESCTQAFAPEMEHICGRPLGLRFDVKSGNLYIADAYLGLQVVGPTGGLATPLVNEFEGQPLLFTNDMDIDDLDNAIYFTDTSTVFQRRQFVASIVTGDRTGRLMKYDKTTKEVTVILGGLAFANGVALSKDRSFVLVAETSTCRIIRYWLKGPLVGSHDIFVELPGYPDNVRINSRGEFWVALLGKTSPLGRLIISDISLGKTLLQRFTMQRLHDLLVGELPHATVIKLSEDGRVVEVLEDVEGETVRSISEVDERNGKLWIGSVMMPFLGVYAL